MKPFTHILYYYIIALLSLLSSMIVTPTDVFRSHLTNLNRYNKMGEQELVIDELSINDYTY